MLKHLVSQAADIFDAAQKDDIMVNVVNVLANWKAQGAAAGGDVDLDASFSGMLNGCWSGFESSLSDLRGILSDSKAKGKTAVSKRGKRKGANAADMEVEESKGKEGHVDVSSVQGGIDAVYSLVLRTSRLLAFSKRIDTREFCEDYDSASMTSRMLDSKEAYMVIALDIQERELKEKQDRVEEM